jgi:hypothetical protein
MAMSEALFKELRNHYWSNKWLAYRFKNKRKFKCIMELVNHTRSPLIQAGYLVSKVKLEPGETIHDYEGVIFTVKQLERCDKSFYGYWVESGHGWDEKFPYFITEIRIKVDVYDVWNRI